MSFALAAASLSLRSVSKIAVRRQFLSNYQKTKSTAPFDTNMFVRWALEQEDMTAPTTADDGKSSAGINTLGTKIWYSDSVQNKAEIVKSRIEAMAKFSADIHSSPALQAQEDIDIAMERLTNDINQKCRENQKELFQNQKELNAMDQKFEQRMKDMDARFEYLSKEQENLKNGQENLKREAAERQEQQEASHAELKREEQEEKAREQSRKQRAHQQNQAAGLAETQEEVAELKERIAAFEQHAAALEQQAAEQKEAKRAADESEMRVATKREEWKAFMDSWTSRVHDELNDAEILRLSQEQQEMLSKHPRPLADR